MQGNSNYTRGKVSDKAVITLYLFLSCPSPQNSRKYKYCCPVNFSLWITWDSKRQVLTEKGTENKTCVTSDGSKPASFMPKLLSFRAL